ncbi:MAG: response regulator [Polyangiaceae bacterium]|nr:response regulator [Polyangiaceae bacterium]
MISGVSLPPAEQPRVLVVDDEKFIRDILADFLTMEGYLVRTADDGQRAVEELSRGEFNLVLSDLKMPRMGGLELLQHISRHHPDTLTVIMTGFGTVETAIDAMKRGAYDYILKPFKVDEIVHVIQRGLDKQRLAAENLRLREALSLYKVSEAITHSLSLDEVVATVAENALTEIRADAVMMWLDDGEGNYFERLSEIRSSGTPSRSCGTLAPLVVQERLSQGQPVIIHGSDGLKLFDAHPQYSLVSTAIVPLRVRAKLIGWIGIASWTEGHRFTEGQRKLLSIVASRTAAAIENARLYEDLQATFQQTIKSLANTIDKLDRYTAGHSERVALYASRLARWMGLSEADIEIVRQAALMHDIGKIGCVLNLNKPGKLTAGEYEDFQKHPTYGKEILDPIQFLTPVIPGVFLHHERWDGRGYPLGLKGTKIPLIARIISVADTYDAMTSDRAYRKALPHEVTVDEIERCSKSQFDPDAAGVFLEKIDAFREEERAAGKDIPE